MCLHNSELFGRCSAYAQSCKIDRIAETFFTSSFQLPCQVGFTHGPPCVNKGFCLMFLAAHIASAALAKSLDGMPDPSAVTSNFSPARTFIQAGGADVCQIFRSSTDPVYPTYALPQPAPTVKAACRTVNNIILANGWPRIWGLSFTPHCEYA